MIDASWLPKCLLAGPRHQHPGMKLGWEAHILQGAALLTLDTVRSKALGSVPQRLLTLPGTPVLQACSFGVLASCSTRGSTLPTAHLSSGHGAPALLSFLSWRCRSLQPGKRSYSNRKTHAKETLVFCKGSLTLHQTPTAC